jgi:hypothetical protein
MDKASMSVPEVVQADPSAEAILSVWSVRDGQVFSVRVQHWDDPAAWGILLADLARHIARGYAEEGSRTEEVSLQRLMAGLRAESQTSRANEPV